MAIFGDFLSKFKLSNVEEESIINSNKIATDNSDGAILSSSEMSNFTMNFDWKYSDQAQLLEYYREISNYQEVDYAIEDIINEMVSFSEGERCITLDLENIDENIISKKIKESIYNSFNKIFNILDLNDTIHQRVREFYIDGRLAYQKVIDPKNPKNGIIGIVKLDTKFVNYHKVVIRNPLNDTIMKEEKKFYYSDKNDDKSKTKDVNMSVGVELELNPDILTYITSGLIDYNTGYTISWLHKAVKPANQLRLMENAVLIYRITRAPERRVFNVSTGGMPKQKAEQYIRNLASNYRNRMSYDPDTGSFKDSRHLMTMQEDFWFAKDSNGKGTDVDTLSGGQNLGEIDDIIYFQKRLYKALNIPVSRLEPEASIQLGGRQSEISRDELKLSKFISKVRKRFNLLLLDLLKTELITTKVITINEWEKINQLIEFRYSQDMYLEEQKKQDLFMSRIEIADSLKDYVGKYFSNEYVMKEIFNMTEEEIDREKKLIETEKTNIIFNNNNDE